MGSLACLLIKVMALDISEAVGLLDTNRARVHSLYMLDTFRRILQFRPSLACDNLVLSSSPPSTLLSVGQEINIVFHLSRTDQLAQRG